MSGACRWDLGLSLIHISYDYDDLARDYLGMTVPSRADLLGKQTIKKALESDEKKAFTCICYMGYIAFMSADRLTEELKKAEMYSLFTDIEMPLIYSLFHMEQVGIKAERERLKEYGDRLKAVSYTHLSTREARV